MNLTTRPNQADLPNELDLDEDLDVEFVAEAPSSSAAPITLELSAEACGQRLDKVIAGLVPEYSRARLQLWIDSGHVTVDGKPARGKDTVYGDETIVILPQAAPEDEAYKAEPIDLDIVYEDEHILVINKPAGLVVHPGAGNWS
ncbi:MAG TPA: S4 domain-containing protein, partial [Telluria sp.]|nr:S4 domain-containing protein [Telluria sp.]